MELLEFLQEKPEITADAPEAELQLRCMVEAKLEDLQKPRSDIIPFKDAPRRI